MLAILNLAVFLGLAFVVLRVCYLNIKGLPKQRYKARPMPPPKKIEPLKRPNAFDPADKGALYLSEEDKRWFNHIARLCERPEPYPLSETGLPEAKMKAAGYTREIPEGEWVSVSMPFTGTWYRAVQENKFAKEVTDSLRDDSVTPTPN